MAISMNWVFPIASIAAFTVNTNTENPTIATMVSISFFTLRYSSFPAISCKKVKNNRIGCSISSTARGKVKVPVMNSTRAVNLKLSIKIFPK